MAASLTLSVGINRLHPDAYDGHWDGSPMCGAEHDAGAFAHHSTTRGADVRTLMGSEATRAAVIESLKTAVRAVAANDIFQFFFAGHGGFVPNENRIATPDADAQLDQTLCMFDGMIVDDELRAIWAMARPGVRIFTCFDSCHSGSAYKAVALGGRDEYTHARFATGLVMRQTYARHREFYGRIQRETAGAPAIKASMIHIGACEDHQQAEEYRCRGKFSFLLNAELRSGPTYRELFDRVHRRAPDSQKPTWHTENDVTAFANRDALT
jgi:metacaspase-1